MNKSIVVALLMGLPVVAADGNDGGTLSTSAIEIQLRDVNFDGTRLEATVSLVGVRDTLIDTRLDEMPLLWPKRITTCAGANVPFRVPVFPRESPVRGEELLLKSGYKFERRVEIYYLRTKLQPGTCVDVEMRLVGPSREEGHMRVIGTTTLRTTVTSRQ